MRLRFPKLILICALILIAIFSSTSNTIAGSKELFRALQSEAALQVLMNDMGLQNAHSVEGQEVSRDSSEGFETIEYVLSNSFIGNIRIAMTGINGFMERRDRSLQSMLIVSGFHTGKDAVKFISTSPEFVLIAVEYPYSANDFANDPATIIEFLRRTPAQIAATLQWTSEQAWLRPGKLVATGVSLGGIFLPSALHINKKLQTPVAGAIFAYTGADLGLVLENALREKNSGIHVPHEVTDAIMLVHDPKIHLPYLTGAFLTIRASEDGIFPAATSEMIDSLLPQPKTMRVVPGPHITEGQPEMINMTRNIVLEWISELNN